MLSGAGLPSRAGGVLRGPTPFPPYIPLLDVMSPGRMVQPEHMWSQMAPGDEAFTDSAVFRNIAPGGYRHLACGAARRTGELAQTLVVLRGPAAPFETDEMQLLEFLLPHFARAEQTRRALGAALADRAAALAATDALCRGVILLDARGRLRSANAIAEAILHSRGQDAGLEAGRCRGAWRDRDDLPERAAGHCPRAGQAARPVPLRSLGVGAGRGGIARLHGRPGR